MNKIFWKTLAFLFGIFSLGSISESYRIITSSAPDIASQRVYLMIMAMSITAILIGITIFFWRKSK